MKNLLNRLGFAAGGLLVGLLSVAAWLLGPLDIARLVKTVSIPRLNEHRTRSSLTILGVSLGVAVLIAVSIVSDSVMNGVNATVDDLAGKADLQLSTGSGGFEESVLQQVLTVPGVYKATPIVQQTTTILNPAARGDRLLVVGVDMLGTDDAYFRDYKSSELSDIRREPLPFLNSTTNVLISRAVAERLQLRVHDKLSLSTENGVRDFDVWGFLEGEGVGRAFGGAVALMYYPSMQVAFSRGDHIDRIDVAVKPGHDVEGVVKGLKAGIGRGFNVDRPAMRGERVSNMLAAVRTALSFGSLIALMTGGFLVFNTMAISLVQRRRELGTLQALGLTRSQLVQLLTLEGTLIGIVGSFWGVWLGLGLSHVLLQSTARALSKVYLQQAITQVHVTPSVLIVGCLLGIVTTTVASAVPAFGAASTKVARALRTGALVTTEALSLRPGLADWMALLLLALAYLLMGVSPSGELPLGALFACTLVLVSGRLLMPRVIQVVHALAAPVICRLFGLDGRLANDNLPRDVGRTSATATGLMAGGALMVGFAAFNHAFLTSLDTWSSQAVPGDLFVTSGASIGGLSGRNTPLSPALGEELRALPGVEAIQRIRFTEQDYRSFPIKLVSYDTAVADHYIKSTYLEGTKEDAKQLRDGKVVVSENFAHRFGVHKGDTIELSGKQGAVPFEIAAIQIDYSSDVGTVCLEREVYRKHWDDLVDTYELHLRPGTALEPVRRVINERFGERYNLFVLTNAEFRAVMVDAAAAVFSIMRVLEYVMLAVAALGIINSLLANVLDRIREIGVLRALGMPRRKVSKMVVMEATLVGLVGVVSGALTGLAVGFVILKHVTSEQTGWHFAYLPPWGTVWEVALIVLPISALAGFYPARQAGALRVREALDYE